jgi:hypothetical protein
MASSPGVDRLHLLILFVLPRRRFYFRNLLAVTVHPVSSRPAVPPRHPPQLKTPPLPSLSRWRTGWLACLLGLHLPGQVCATEELGASWQALSYGFYNDAGDAFVRAGDARAARLGAAIAQINRSPITATSLTEARRQLEALLAGEDEIAHAARYFLGRLHQLHPIQPDAAAAAREFETLVATGADDVWCRLALVKLAILQLTTLPAAGGLDARLAAVAPYFDRTQAPSARRDLHLVIAEVLLHHQRYDAITRTHLQAALAAPGLNDDIRADLLIQIARLSEILGDTAMSRSHYERFLREFPRDRRQPTVELILSGREAPGPS